MLAGLFQLVGAMAEDTVELGVQQHMALDGVVAGDLPGELATMALLMATHIGPATIHHQ